VTIVRGATRGMSPEDAFRSAFGRHYGAVFGYCARRLGWDDASDAVADVFTVAWRRIRRIPAEPETLPWLYGVARNVVSNHLRSTRRRQRLDERAAVDLDGTTIEDQQDLDAVLASLGADDREILMLSAWEGLGPAEIGRALGCSSNTAAVRLHRARARLSAAWDNQERGAR
jgi:RNA polymerase sigma-70 factor (ECF subfamily)